MDRRPRPGERHTRVRITWDRCPRRDGFRVVIEALEGAGDIEAVGDSLPAVVVTNMLVAKSFEEEAPRGV